MTGAGHAPLDAARWVEVAVVLTVADAELVADALGALAEGGAALEPRISPTDDREFGYEIEAEGALVRAFLPAPLAVAQRRALRRRLAALPLGGPLPRLRYRSVEEIDWSAAWREHFSTLRIGRLVVRPSWEPVSEGEDALTVTLDPGRAFGTGQHPSTRLCLAALEREPVLWGARGSSVLDVGCGSGILALAAARLGAARVDALDVDAEAVGVACENVRRNGLEARVRVLEGSLGTGWPAAWGNPAGRYDLVLANISSAVVLELLPSAAAALRPGGRLIASGFMADRAGEIAAAARAAGFTGSRVEQDGEWCALVAERGS